VLDRTATAWLKRLLIWLEVFERDFMRIPVHREHSF
jgi:hypothetical protein